MSKHTPGPWKLMDEQPTAVIQEDGNAFAAWTPSIDDHRGASIAEVKMMSGLHNGKRLHVDNMIEARANARLIATAPELLRALKLCLSVVATQNGNLHDDTNQIQELANAAIAKAEGTEVPAANAK